MAEQQPAASPAAAAEPGQAAAEQPGQQPAPAQPAAAPAGAPAAPAAAPEGQPAQEPAPPERYELHLPEGSLLGQSDVERVVTLAKEQKWSQEQAQDTLAEMHKQITATASAFLTELDGRADLGGANLADTQRRAVGVIDRFLPSSDPDGVRLRAELNRTGYGNFTPLVKLLSNIAKAMGEDRPVAGVGAAGAGPPGRSQAERLFGDAQGVVKAT